MATKGSKTSSHHWIVQPVQFDNGEKINTRFDIAPISTDKDAILGMPFLRDTEALINLKNGAVKLNKPSLQLIKYKKIQARNIKIQTACITTEA